jgi:hyperosmotically inducible protein
MKTIHGMRAALGVAILTASLGAWAQASAPADMSASAPAGAMAAAPGATSAKAMRQANRALRRKVYAALAQHKVAGAGNIGITAKGGAITLNGTVTDAPQIDAVAQVVKGVAGVTSVTNRLTVQRPIGE